MPKLVRKADVWTMTIAWPSAPPRGSGWVTKTAAAPNATTPRIRILMIPRPAVTQPQPEGESNSPAAVIVPRHSRPDPAFALIAEKRAADIAYGEVIDAQDEAEGRYGIHSDEASEAADRCGAACRTVNAIDWRLATTPPMTPAGIAAVLRFANEHEDAGGEWPDTDAIGREGWHYQLRATMAAALEAIIRQTGV